MACGTIWTLGKGMKDGDLVVTPDPAGILHVGQVTGPYAFVPGEELPHRRPVSWQFGTINRDEMSAELRRSTDRYPATLANISQHLVEIESLLQEAPQLVSTDPDVEDPVQFALEKYLEEFLYRQLDEDRAGEALRHLLVMTRATRSVANTSATQARSTSSP